VKVGSYSANGYGLFDMTGNVAEWTADWYNRTYYSVTPDKNPKGPETGMYRVFRGGSWSDTDERILGIHYRNYTNPDLRADVLGFRCAK
jgi:iron(II)-dependent oxidoreductase